MRSLALFTLASAAVACGFTAAATSTEDLVPGSDASVADARARDAVGDAVQHDVDVVPDAGAEADADAMTTDADADAAVDPPTAVGATTVAATSLTVDLVAASDGPIVSDGQNDGVLALEVTGPVLALALVRTDGAGTPTGAEQWDTWVGADVIPLNVGTVHAAGGATFQLGVYQAGALLNDASGRVALGAGQHSLTLAGASVGSFVAGNHFRVLAQRPDGQIVRGPVLAY